MIIRIDDYSDVPIYQQIRNEIVNGISSGKLQEGEPTLNEKDILEEVLDEFGAIAKIPRPSKHEQAIAQYLAERLSSLGLTVEQDPIGNVIAELAPSKGSPETPRVIMQAHMDMVCVAAEGVAYDPLTDPIKPIRAEGYLHADGTSLGADDGMGIAIILYTLKHLVDNPELKHGAVRAIFTVDEEAGMSGLILTAKQEEGATVGGTINAGRNHR